MVFGGHVRFATYRFDPGHACFPFLAASRRCQYVDVLEKTVVQRRLAWPGYVDRRWGVVLGAGEAEHAPITYDLSPITDRLAAFDDESEVVEGGGIEGGVAADGDEVGVLAALQGADGALQS
jgi:hypothetical protein